MSIKLKLKHLAPPDGSSQDNEYIFVGEDMPASSAKKIEFELKSDPHNLAYRLMLIGYYGSRKPNQDRYLEQVVWMIENRPRDVVVYFLWNGSYTDSFLWTKSQTEKVSNLWNVQIRKYPNCASVLCNAAAFFSNYNSRKSEMLLRRAKLRDKNLALPALELAYLYRKRAMTSPQNWVSRFVQRAVTEAVDAIDRGLETENEGEYIGLLQEFTPTAIKFGYIRAARDFAKRLEDYGDSFYMWEQYACLFQAWIALREGRIRRLRSKLGYLQDLFEANPSRVGISNAAISFVSDALRQSETNIAEQVLKILILGSSEKEVQKECSELREWLASVQRSQEPKLEILQKELDLLY